jgi:glutamyl-tRNA synthetase
VRGSDLIPSSAAQIFLAEKLWNNDFYKMKFFHHLLLPDEHGQKLSKSESSLSLKTMRENGLTKEDVLMKLKPLLALEK